MDDSEFARTAVGVDGDRDDAVFVTEHGDETPPSRMAMRLLAAGVPLSLLLDLACPLGPDSELIAAAERSAAA